MKSISGADLGSIPRALPFVINFYHERLVSLDSYLPISPSFFDPDTKIYVTFPILLTPNQFLDIPSTSGPEGYSVTSPGRHIAQYTFF
jgi:hypothetical protein